MPKQRKGKGKDMIVTKNIGSIFDRLYGDIHSVITNFFTLADACELMTINKQFLLFLRAYRWCDTNTPVYDIRLFTHVFPNALNPKLALNKSCGWNNNMEYEGSHKMIFTDFSLLKNGDTLILDNTFKNSKSDDDLISGFLAIPSNIKVIKIINDYDYIASKFLEIISLCSDMCIVIELNLGDDVFLDYYHDPTGTYVSKNLTIPMPTLQDLVSKLVAQVPAILPTKEEIMANYMISSRPYWIFPSELLENMMDIEAELCFEETKYDESNLSHLASDRTIKIKCRINKNQTKWRKSKLSNQTFNQKPKLLVY
jgi:hypothetical protein